MMLRIGSLFSGYGGLDGAVESVLPARTAWVSDIDPGACKVLAHRYPDVPNLGDITTIDWSTVEPVDIITGGSPCQDLSTAGARAGMTDGTRSNLWVQMREAIAHVQPRFVVWENVRGAYSAHAASDLEHCTGCMGDPTHRGPVLRALGRVLGDLSDLGYDTQWRGVRASDVGACHQRFRVFVLAWRRDAAADDARGSRGHEAIEHDGSGAQTGHRAGVPHQPDRVAAGPGPGGALTLLPTPAASVANDGEGTETWLARRERVKLTAANGNGMGMPLTIAVQLLPTPNVHNNENRQSEGFGPNLGTALGLLPTPRATDGTKGGPGQRGSKGDLMLPSAVMQLLPTPVADNSRGLPSEGTDFQSLPNAVVSLLPTPLVGSTSEASHGQISGQYREAMAHALANWGQYATAISRHEHMLGRPAPSPTEPGRNGKPRLSAAFTEWMMGLPDGWITDVPGVTRSEALKLCGNGVVPQQAEAALRDMLAAMRQAVAA